MTTTRSEEETLGTYVVSSWRGEIPGGSFGLSERKREIDEVQLPKNQFSQEDHPVADTEIWGEPIPIAFGKIRGAPSYVIDRASGIFQFCDHAVNTVEAIYDAEGIALTPDSISLATGRFLYAAWDQETAYFVDFTADKENPIDAIEELLTDDTRGADIPSARIETPGSADKRGFGTNGGRRVYVWGTDKTTGFEVTAYPIGLWIGRTKKVSDWIKQIAAAAFVTFFVNREGKYQVAPFFPGPGEGLPEITIGKIIGKPKVSFTPKDPVTNTIARYGASQESGDSVTYSFIDDEMRQRRGLTSPAIQEVEIPVTTQRAAKFFAEANTYLRSRPQRVYTLKVVQEYMLLEPGQFVRLVYAPLNINETMEVLEINVRPGSTQVDLKLTDIRAWEDHYGIWVDDPFEFPASLGGAEITAWDDTWSDAQKDWARENGGFWTDANGYLDAANDSVLSFDTSKWF